MTSLPAKLTACELPDFGTKDTDVTLPVEIYANRLAALRERMAKESVDQTVIYGDREHNANLQWLTGFDPRFEEAVAVVGLSGRVTLVVGNECKYYATSSPADVEIVWFPEFSLVGQPRGLPNGDLVAILQAAGLKSGQKVGVAAWKYHLGQDGSVTRDWFDLPAFILRDIQGIAGESNVTNVADWFMAADSGFRAICELEQMAVFEAAATRSSDNFCQVLFGLHEGMNERDLVRRLQFDGDVLTCHAMMSSGERTVFGLASPSFRSISVGEPVVMVYGVQGALTCRAGVWARSSDELPNSYSDYVDVVVEPYFKTVVKWYSAMRVGQTGGALWQIAVDGLPTPFFNRELNPGHLIHYEEWMNSQVHPGSTDQMLSGMCIQVDIIPNPSKPYPTTNIEDGIGLADEGLRKAFAAKYPAAWDRITKRREFMIQILGIELHADVLPFSNIPAYLPPYWLDPRQAMSFGA